MKEDNRLTHAIDQVHLQQEHRKLWAQEDDASSVAGFLLNEAQELVDAIEESMVTGDVFSVASEIGDVLFVVHRLCAELGIDPADALDMKVKRNAMKYTDAVLSNGYSHKEATALSKNAWKGMGGDEVFSHVYLDVLADLHDED